MSLKQLRASRALWRSREVYRERRLKAARKAKDPKRIKKWEKLLSEARSQRMRRDRQIESATSWGGSRAVTDEVIAIVGNRARVTSRKRAADDPLSLANPGSDHSGQNKTADAVDFAIANAHWLKNEIGRKLGGPDSLVDFGSFIIKRNGKKYRVQIIAGTHGTGPHLHVGVKRV